MKNIKRN